MGREYFHGLTGGNTLENLRSVRLMERASSRFLMDQKGQGRLLMTRKMEKAFKLMLMEQRRGRFGKRV